MKPPSEERRFFCGAARWAAALTALVILAMAPCALANNPEPGASGTNSKVGQNDFMTSDLIVTGSGFVDYALPPFSLGGPMELSVSLKYNRAMNNWWSETRNYFPTHGGNGDRIDEITDALGRTRTFRWSVVTESEKLRAWPLFWQEAKDSPGKQQGGPAEIKLSGDWHDTDGQVETAPFKLGTGDGR